MADKRINMSKNVLCLYNFMYFVRTLYSLHVSYVLNGQLINTDA